MCGRLVRTHTQDHSSGGFKSGCPHQDGHTHLNDDEAMVQTSTLAPRGSMIYPASSKYHKLTSMNGHPINKALREKTRALVVSALELLISYLQTGEQVPSTLEETHKLVDAGWRIGQVNRPLYEFFLHRHRKEIEGMPEYSAFAHSMRSDKKTATQLDTLIGTRDSQIRRTLWDYVVHLLTKQLSEYPGRLSFDTSCFDRMYDDLEQFFCSDTIPLRAFAPLLNFSSDADEIDLGGGAHLRKITSRETEQMLDEGSQFSQLPFFDTLSTKYAIELTWQAKKIVGRADRKARDMDVGERVNKVLTALRLFKQGATGFNIIRTRIVLDLPYEAMATRMGLHKQFWGPAYTLNETEKGEFVAFWNTIDKLDLEQPAALSVAVRRFNYAYDRHNLEDKLVDFMVAFEALFFKEGESGEFRHKLSTRVARFLNVSYEERKRVAEEMNDFYDKRSSVVHGENVGLKDEFVSKVEDYLRRSIRLFLERLQTLDHNQVIRHLDLG